MNKKKVNKYLEDSINLAINQQVKIDDDEWKMRVADHFGEFPKKLYKYAKLNRFTFDAIEQNYIFLCRADKLDDQFECKAKDTTLKRFKNAKGEQDILSSILDMLPKLLANYPLPFSAEKIVSTLKNNMNSLPKKPTANSMAKIMGYEITDKEETASKAIVNENTTNEGAEIIEQLYSKVREFKKSKRIGSLTECKSSQVMWEMYADHYKGICIEYELCNDSGIMFDTFPVKYSKKREIDLLMVSLGIVLDSLVFGMSNGALNPTNNMQRYIEILLTKYTEWSFQKEWRIIGGPKAKIKVPKIKRVFVGKNVSKKNMDRLFRIAKEQGIRLYRQYDDEDKLQIKYEPISL